MLKTIKESIGTIIFVIIAIATFINFITSGWWFVCIIFGGLVIALSVVEWREGNKPFKVIPISIIISILAVILSYQYPIMTENITTMELPGVIKEKYTAGAGSRSHLEIVYKTTIEVRENDDTYIITLDDESLFNSHIVGDEVTVKKKVTTKKKDNSVLSTNFSYAR